MDWDRSTCVRFKYWAARTANSPKAIFLIVSTMPVGPDVQHRLRQIAALPADELAKLAGRIGQRPAEAAKNTVSLDFREKTPDDVGRPGWYSPLECSMDPWAAYVERFRGNDDLSADLDERLKAVDRLTGIVSDFLRTHGHRSGTAAPLQASCKANWPRPA